MNRPIGCVGGAAVAVVLVLAAAISPELLASLALGWASFLARVVPEMAIGRASLATAAGCLVLVAALGHGFAGWLLGQMAPGRRWPGRWTAAGLAGVILMFVAGIAAAGAAHQVGWLIMAPEPLFAPSIRAAARRTQSLNNLKQIGVALLGYEQAAGSLPPAATIDPEGRLIQGWQAVILASPGQEDWRAPPPGSPRQADPAGVLDLARPWDDPANAGAIGAQVARFRNPGCNPPGGSNASHYAGNAWVLGGAKAWKLRELTDGADRTILVGEAAGEFRPWADPGNWRDPRLGINRSPRGFGGPYRGGANFLFADGSVRFLKDKIQPRVFEALCTPAGGEAVAADDY